MAVDLNQFSNTLTYSTTAPIADILTDLQAIASFDQIAEVKKKRFNTILVIALIGIFVSFFLFALVVGFITLPICVILAIYAGIMSHKYGRRDIANYRYEFLQKLLPMIRRDADPDAPIGLHLVLSSPTDPTKKTDTTPDPHRSGWKIDHFQDSWLSLRGDFLDGTHFSLSAIEFHVTKYGWKRSRSGKSKFKKKSKAKGLQFELAVTSPRRKYGALSILKEEAIKAVQLPDTVRLMRLKATENRLVLTTKTPAWVSSTTVNSLYQTVTMMFLSLYQVLNLARLLSKKSEVEA